jgi:undecaprenyl-diphosphatase
MRFVRILLFFSLIATAVIYMYPRTWELDLIANLQATSTGFSVLFFQTITDYVDVISVGIPVVLLITGLIRQNKSLREKALLILFSVALAGALSNSLKRVVKEPRPYEVDTRIAQRSGGGGYGFPSGHAADAVAAATAFSLLWPELFIITPFYCWALIIMFSRIYLGVHDPGDVLAGMFLGILSALAVLKIRDSLNQSRAKASAQ